MPVAVNAPVSMTDLKDRQHRYAGAPRGAATSVLINVYGAFYGFLRKFGVPR
jgi:hypothetical protein